GRLGQAPSLILGTDSGFPGACRRRPATASRPPDFGAPYNKIAPVGNGRDAGRVCYIRPTPTHSPMPKNTVPRLIYASSEESADMLYATKFSAPDAFLFLQQRGKRSILLGDLEIDRGKKQAMVDEVISLSAIEALLEKRLKAKPAVGEIIA